MKTYTVYKVSKSGHKSPVLYTTNENKAKKTCWEYECDGILAYYE